MKFLRENSIIWAESYSFEQEDRHGFFLSWTFFMSKLEEIL